MSILYFLRGLMYSKQFNYNNLNCDPLEQFDLINFFFSFNNAVIFLLLVSFFCIVIFFFNSGKSLNGRFTI